MFSNFISGVIGAFVVSLLSFYFVSDKISNLEAELKQRPPVVVVDFVELAKNYPPNIDEAGLERIMANTHQTVVKLIESGYLVFDKSEVIGAPKDLYLPTDLIIKGE